MQVFNTRVFPFAFSTGEGGRGQIRAVGGSVATRINKIENIRQGSRLHES